MDKTNEDKKFRPDYIVLPCDLLSEWLECQDITFELASKLEKFTGIKGNIWLKLAEDERRVKAFIKGMNDGTQ